MGPLSPNGYGRISIYGKGLKHAHRESFVAFNGLIAAGLHISHICRNKCCVNPSHLRAITQSENLRYDYAAAPWGNQNTGKTHCPRGHEYAGLNLRIVRGKRYCRECVNAQKRDRRKA